jgi:RNA polymerase sigma factor (sigma-70 family)
MKPSLPGRAAVWTAAISAAAVVPRATPVALGLVAAREGFDLVHARMRRTSVLAYIRAADAGTYLSVAAFGADPGVVLQTTSARAGPAGGGEGAGPMPAHDEPHRSGAGCDPDEFCAKHRADWLNYAAAQARSFQDAEDAVSHVSEKVVRYHAKTGWLCPPKFDDPVAWSKKVIANYITDLHRRSSRQLKYQARLCSPPDEGFQEDLIDELLARSAFQFINNLKPRDHQIAVMRFIENLEPADIAHALGMNQVTVRTSLHRISKGMRRQLGIASKPQKIIPGETT